MAEQLAGGLKVVVNGPRLVHVIAVVSGDAENCDGNEMTAVVV